MKSMVALIKREYLEHRGAFLYAPAGILVVLCCIMLSGVTVGRFSSLQKLGVITGIKGFEIGFLAIAGLWFLYLLAALFFYFADAFSADGRNNAMLFWKSMPQSDFKILASKMFAGLTLFPALIFVAVILSGIIVYAGTLIISLTLTGFRMSGPLDFLASGSTIIGFGLIYLALGLLWYAPFFAWVGLLSTLFRRWSIPLAFLIPGLVGLAENVLLPDTGPQAGYVLGYLHDRASFGIGREDMGNIVFSGTPFEISSMLTRLVAAIDWPQLAGGLIVAALLVYLASIYRRSRAVSI